VRSRIFSFSYNRYLVYKKHALVTEIRKWVNPESLAFLGILIGSLFITSYKPYLLLLAAYIGVVYFFSLNSVNAVWQGFISALLFYKAKYFVFPYASNLALSYGLTAETPIVYHVTFADVMLIVLLYVVLRNRRSTEQPTSPHLKKIALTAGALLVWGALSSLWSHFAGVSWFSLFKLAEYIVIFFVALHVFGDKQIRAATLRNILLFVFFNAGLIILQKFHGGPLGFAAEDFSTGSFGRFADENTSLYRPGGIYFEPNLPATLMVLFLPVVTWFSVVKSKQSLWFFAPFCMLLFAIVATASRVNWMITALLLVIIYLILPKKIKLDRSNQLKKIGLLLGLGALIELPLIVSRLGSLGVAFSEESGGYSFRLRHLQLAYEFMQKSLFGVGIDVFQYQLLETLNPERYYFHFTSAHNVLAEVAAGLGAIGFGIYCLLLLLIFKNLTHVLSDFWRQGRYSLITLQSGIPVFLSLGYIGFWVSSMFFPWLFAPPLTEISWIVLALIYGYSRI
jgi:hypothetical protein